MKIMERKYICANGVVERTRYAVGDNAQPRGKRRRGHSSMRKQEQNFNTAVRRLARTLNCNCTHETSYLITLDYSDEGLQGALERLCEEAREELDTIGYLSLEIDREEYDPDARLEKAPAQEKEQWSAVEALREAAEHDVTLYLRRAKRIAAAKYAAVTANLNGRTGELVRVHHHIVLILDKPVGQETLKKLQKAWKQGGCDIRQLRHQKDYTPLAVYLMNQASRVTADAKKYRVSTGMEKPQTVEREIAGHTEIKAPPGANVIERSQYSIDCFGQYIRYIPKKRTYSRKRTMETDGDEHGRV